MVMCFGGGGVVFVSALTEKVRAREDSRPTDLRFLVEWLAGVWCGRCGLVARVPQDRMLL